MTYIYSIDKLKHRKMKNEKKIIVAFHIGRGGRFYNAGYKEFIGEKKIGDYTDNLFLNEDETAYVDCNGNQVGLTVEEELTGVGCINIDNQYNTTYTCYVEDCDESELAIICESTNYKSKDLIAYLKANTEFKLDSWGVVIPSEEE